jgi:hypothetical protein
MDINRIRTRMALAALTAGIGVLSGCSDWVGQDTPTQVTMGLTHAFEILWRGEATDDAGMPTLASVPSAGALSPSGNVALVDRMTGSLVLLDQQGRLILRLDRKGGGPGEFRDPRQVGFESDDLVWVSDAASGRLTWFEIDGTVAKELARPWEPVPGSVWSALGAWALRSGAVLGDVTGPRDPRGGTYPPVPVALWDGAGTLRTVAWVPVHGPTVMQVTTPAGPAAGSAQPIDATPLVAVPPGGEWFLLIDRSPVERGGRGEIRISRFGPDGNPKDAMAIPYIPVQAGEAAHVWLQRQGEWRAELLNRHMPPELGRVTAEDVVQAIWLPRFLPPVRNALAANEGVWLQRERPFPTLADGPNVWEYYDLSGSLKKRVEMPSGFEGLAAHENALLGVTTDSLGVPEIWLKRIVKPGR